MTTPRLYKVYNLEMPHSSCQIGQYLLNKVKSYDRRVRRLFRNPYRNILTGKMVPGRYGTHQHTFDAHPLAPEPKSLFWKNETQIADIGFIATFLHGRWVIPVHGKSPFDVHTYHGEPMCSPRDLPRVLDVALQNLSERIVFERNLGYLIYCYVYANVTREATFHALLTWVAFECLGFRHWKLYPRPELVLPRAKKKDYLRKISTCIEQQPLSPLVKCFANKNIEHALDAPVIQKITHAIKSLSFARNIHERQIEKPIRRLYKIRNRIVHGTGGVVKPGATKIEINRAIHLIEGCKIMLAVSIGELIGISDASVYLQNYKHETRNMLWQQTFRSIQLY